MECQAFIEILQQQAAEAYALDWDNSGLLLGSRKQEIHRVYIALDATDAAVQEALEMGADMMLTHHPLIFRGLKQITEEDFIGRRIIALIRGGVALYTMHTNFDVMGMAQLAAGMLGLQGMEPLEQTCVENGIPQGIGRVGTFEREMTLQDCGMLVKKAFSREQVKIFGELHTIVKKAAICPGAGKSDLEEALAKGADVYITGDIDHHTGIDAVARGMAIIDAGHYGIEHIFVPYMEQYVKEHAPELEVMVQGRAEPFLIV